MNQAGWDFTASAAGSYRSFSSGSMQSTFWNRTVMNSSGSAKKTHQLENTHRLVIDCAVFVVLIFFIRKPFSATVLAECEAVTFFFCPERVTAKLFAEIHHTFCRHKALSAK